MAASQMRKVKLKEVCERITVGHVGPMADKYASEGIPFLRSQNITPFRLNIEDIKYVPRDFHEKLRKSALKPGDVAVVRTGYPGTACVIPETFHELNCADLVIITPSVALNSHYLAAIFNSAWGIASVAGNLVGVAQQHFNIGAAKDLEVQLPPRPIQDRIAGILSAYDELIENSQRRIKVLETMARNLYRDWFVHYRYPGHENTPLIPSHLGEIPKGWEVKKLGDFVEFRSGFAFKSSTFSTEGEHRLVTIKNVQDGSFNPESESRLTELPTKMPSYCLLEDGDILLSLTGNVGRVCLVYDGPFLLNQRVSKLVPVESFDWAMTYCLFREPAMRMQLEQLSNGVAQQNLSPVLASKQDFACPSNELRQQFSTLASPMVKGIVQLYTKIQNLRKTRDLLLPRLLSGQIPLHTPATQAA